MKNYKIILAAAVLVFVHMFCIIGMTIPVSAETYESGYELLADSSSGDNATNQNADAPEASEEASEDEGGFDLLPLTQNIVGIIAVASFIVALVAIILAIKCKPWWIL